MDNGGRILGLCSIPITLILFFLMARLAGKELPAKKRVYLMGIIMPAAMLFVNAIFLSAGFTPLCGGVSALLFIVGLYLGRRAGKKIEMSFMDDVVVSKRSALPVILWAVSYAVTQLLTTVAPSGGAGIGVAMMFLSAGAAIGMNTNLLRRYRKVRA